MLKKKIVLITGVGKGIGLSCLKLCIKNNAFVIGVTRSKKDYNDLNKAYKDNCKIILGDVRSKATLKKVIDFQKKNNLFINSLVNNAGIRFRKKFLNTDIKEYKNVFEHNFFSIVQICKAMISLAITKKKKISIVNLSSIVGSRGFDELSAYGSSKGALDSFTKCIAIEYPKYVKINNVCPGFTKTSYFDKFKDNKKLYNWTIKNTPVKRWADPEEIAELIVYLVSDKSSYITGQNFYIDGGWTSK